MSLPPPTSTLPKPTGLSSLALLGIFFLLSCGVVLGVLTLEITRYTKGNSGLQAETYWLLSASLLAGLVSVLFCLLQAAFNKALAVVVGLLPVLLLAGLVYQTAGWGPKPRPVLPEPSAQEQAQVRAQVQASLPYAGTDSALTATYSFVEQMPTPRTGGNLADLRDTLSQDAMRALARTATVPAGTVTVSFVVGPRGGIFQGLIEQGLTPAADAAVLAAVRRLPRMYPGKQSGKAVAVRFTVPVPLPAPR